MEEDKNKGELQPNNTKEKEPNIKLPGTSLRYTFEEGGASKPLPGRISGALTGNIIHTKKSLVKKFDNEYKLEDILPADVIDEEGNVFKPIDRDGNLIKLTAIQNRVLFSLSKQIFSRERKDVAEYLEALQRRDEILPPLPKMYILLPSISADLWGEEKRKDAIAISELDGAVNGGLITFSDISGDVFGSDERGRAKRINDIYSELTQIAKIRIPQIYTSETFQDGKGEKHSITLRALRSYITITGNELQLIIDNNVYSAIEIEPSRIFYENNWIGKGSKYFLLGKDTLEARLPSGRKITTDEYWCGLFPLAANYSWYYLFYRLEAVKKQIKKENIIDTERIARLKEDALTTPPISFQRIREAINFQSEHPQEEARFKQHIGDGIWALADRGIITEKSSIDWDNETFTLVFSEPREGENGATKPTIDKDRYTPKKKRSRKKRAALEEKEPQEEQLELFTEKV